MALVNLERMKQVEAALVSGDPTTICAALHEMAGPFNLRMLSTDVDTQLVANADVMSTRLAITIVTDVVMPGATALETLRRIADAMCEWIDTGVPLPGVDAATTQSGLAAQFIADSSNYPVDGPGAAAVRLHCLSRFGPALGAIESVLLIPTEVAVPVPQAN